MEKQMKKISEKTRMNRAAISCYMVMISIITIAYFIEVVKHNRTGGYFLTCLILLWVPAAFVLFTWKKNPEHEKLRYIIAIGFWIPQSFLMFTANNNLVFTYAIIMLIICNVFSDLRFAIIVALLYNVSNITSVLYTFAVDGFSQELLVTSEIQVILLIIVGIDNVIISRTGVQIAAQHVAEVDREKQNVSDLLERVMQISQSISAGIVHMTGRMGTLGEAVSQTCDAMNEVRSGSNETAETIQVQLVMTEEIQNRIDEVVRTVGVIETSLQKTKQNIMVGANNMQELEQQVAASEHSSQEATDKLNELEEYAKNMQTIVELINSVADQTGLLSLNASIEAARAGEAGRGFAVVASEISNLANQTQEATENIEKLIADVVMKLGDVSQAINTFVDGNVRQQQVAIQTVDNYNMIEKDALEIEQNTDILQEAVSKLAEANHQIVESIQNISAITEEVSAHSNETYDSSQKNAEIVDEVVTIVDVLKRKAESLSEQA